MEAPHTDHRPGRDRILMKSRVSFFFFFFSVLDGCLDVEFSCGAHERKVLNEMQKNENETLRFANSKARVFLGIFSGIELFATFCVNVSEMDEARESCEENSCGLRARVFIRERDCLKLEHKNTKKNTLSSR